MIYSKVISTELIFIIKQFPLSYKKKLPQNLIENLYKNFSVEIYSKLDEDKPFFKQQISQQTKQVIYDIINIYF